MELSLGHHYAAAFQCCEENSIGGVREDCFAQHEVINDIPLKAMVPIRQLRRIKHVRSAARTFSGGDSFYEFLKPVYSEALGRAARSFRAIGSTSSRQ